MLSNLHGRCDTTIASCFVRRSDDSTRGNQLKLYKRHVLLMSPNTIFLTLYFYDQINDDDE